MPRKTTPKLCACGCNGMTRGGEFIPGHDAKVYSAIIKHVGGVTSLRKLVEQSTGKFIVVHETLSSVYLLEDVSNIWNN